MARGGVYRTTEMPLIRSHRAAAAATLPPAEVSIPATGSFLVARTSLKSKAKRSLMHGGTAGQIATSPISDGRRGAHSYRLTPPTGELTGPRAATVAASDTQDGGRERSAEKNP
jgi:hypothetical protein